MSDSPDPATAFHELAQLVYGGSTFDEVIHRLVDLAPRVVSGCDHASLMLHEKGQFVTAAASDDIARHVDALEREVGEGPCVDAIQDEPGQIDADIAVRSSWPKLAERVLDETPVRGMAGFRLLVEGKKVGALNLFSNTPGAIEASGPEGAILASFVSIVLRSMANQERVDSLLLGLESNREIGKAIGLLMAAHGVGSEEAFQLLRRASNDMNIKLAEVAREVVDNAERRPATS